jgi:hypothetical protein
VVSGLTNLFFDKVFVMELIDGFFVAMSDATYSNSHLWELRIVSGSQTIK